MLMPTPHEISTALREAIFDAAHDLKRIGSQFDVYHGPLHPFYQGILITLNAAYPHLTLIERKTLANTALQDYYDAVLD